MSDQLSKSDVLAILDNKTELKTASVDVPAWGGQVEIRELTARQRMELSLMVVDDSGKTDFARFPDALLIAAQIGLGLAKSQREQLDLHPDAVQTIGMAVMQMSGMNPTTPEKND